MCLRFVFLLITRMTSWLRLSRREEAWKTAEILLLHHQIAVLQRQQPRRPNLDWADRALLATLLSVIPKARRHGLRLLVTPDTILRWHRDIVRRRWAARSKRARTGRPATRRHIKALVLRLARENPEWGYRRIHGELAGLGVGVSAPTVWEILKKAGIDPAPRRTGPAWSQFLRSQAEAILACDFFIAGPPGGTQAYVLAVIEHAPRRIRNRGSDFTAGFDAVLADAGIRTVLCNDRDAPHERDRRTPDRGMPPRAPGPHPHLEPGPSAADPAPVRDPPRSAPAAPLPAHCRAAETATRAGQSRPVPRPETGSRRWPDQRIPPGRVTWTRFSARTPSCS